MFTPTPTHTRTHAQSNPTLSSQQQPPSVYREEEEDIMGPLGDG